MTDDTWVAKTIQPKSDQLNAEDMLTGPLTVTVQDVRQGDAEQPVAIMIDGRQPYKPCKTMRRVLIALWGDHASEWIGRQLTLYCDPEVKWGGVAVGGIRISHMTDLTGPHTLMLSVARGKRQAFTIQPLTVKPERSVAERVAAAVKAYEDCKTLARLEQLDGHIEGLTAVADDEQKVLIEAARDAAVARHNEAANVGN